MQAAGDGRRKRQLERARLQEEQGAASGDPAQRGQVERGRGPEWAQGNQIEDRPDDACGEEFGKAEKDLVDEIAHIEPLGLKAVETPSETDGWAAAPYDRSLLETAQMGITWPDGLEGLG